MPMMAMVLAVGSGEGASWEIRSAPMLMMAPVSIEAGSIFMCAEVPNIPLVICGATMPTKPNGPQKAVTAAVRMQLLSIALMRIPFTSAPAISAKLSPNRIMSRPLCDVAAIANPMMRAPAIMAI